MTPTADPAPRPDNAPAAAASEARAGQSEGAALHAAVHHAAHFLPTQAPILVFVHHNTLHAFEHLPFEQAVIEGAKLYGAEPYESEAAFARHLASGRIRPADIDAVLAQEPDSSDEPVVPGGPGRRALRRLRLLRLFEVPTGPALSWLLEETSARRRLHPSLDEVSRQRLLRQAESPGGGSGADISRLQRAARERAVVTALWECLAADAPSEEHAALGPRPRDLLRALTGVDTDELVHPLLGRVCAAFIDQGIAYWSMPGRELGLLRAFRALYARALPPIDLWTRGLPQELARAEREGWDAERTVLECLRELGVAEQDWPSFITATLLSLRGWAGMLRELETRPDRAPVAAPPARLLDYLALELVLDLQAARYVADGALGGWTSLPELRRRLPDSPERRDESLVYEAFVVAQLAGLSARQLSSPESRRAWFDEIAAFGSIERRRLLHAAYERRHRVGVLDALLAHASMPVPEPPPPRLQAVLCFDEREESLRRHLEEILPAVRTYGYAGFFGVAMAYQGLHDVKPAALCPVVVTPKHYVCEKAIDGDAALAVAGKRRTLGAIDLATGVGSRTLLRGSVLSALLGMASFVPLVGVTLFPRLTARLTHAMRHRVAGVPKTRLELERSEQESTPRPDGLLPGYTVPEMTTIVENALRTLGLVDHFAPLLIVVGHGSSSVNNPHESAYDCGATGGGRGGPNARAFASMANHPGVRDALAERGIRLPETTWCVGAFHNTGNDSVDWLDDDLVPPAFRAELDAARVVFEEARRRDAHERCRRFESAPRTRSAAKALAHVEGRSVHLAQPRPECGHATNAICVVGRRERTRSLFLDRRAFLVSYDPDGDPTGKILAGLLQAVGPVGAGISLEYYFSYVDSAVYGCGSKLPHNIVGLVGVMDGHASDLRTGLPWQMVEIHEPVRLLTIVEAEPALLEKIAAEYPVVGNLVVNRWIQLVAWSPSTGRLSVFGRSGFEPYEPESRELATVASSAAHYHGHIDHLPCVRIAPAPTSELRP